MMTCNEVGPHGLLAACPKKGGWTAAFFIIGTIRPTFSIAVSCPGLTLLILVTGVEIAEICAYYGISLNMITYFTGHLNQSIASSAAALNIWSGVLSMMPLIGAFFADSYIGRYKMIVISSVLYVLGMGLLSLSSLLHNLSNHSQLVFVYCSLYLIAFSQGGFKPCVQAFGADQFNESVLSENKSRSSFFHWWYFGMNMGATVSMLILSYVVYYLNSWE